MSIPGCAVKMRASFSVYFEVVTKMMDPRELCAFWIKGPPILLVEVWLYQC